MNWFGNVRQSSNGVRAEYLRPASRTRGGGGPEQYHGPCSCCRHQQPRKIVAGGSYYIRRSENRKRRLTAICTRLVYIGSNKRFALGIRLQCQSPGLANNRLWEAETLRPLSMSTPAVAAASSSSGSGSRWKLMPSKSCMKSRPRSRQYGQTP